MSQREASQQNYGSARSQSRTQRGANTNQRQQLFRPQHTERQLHGDSPTRHDVQFYVRKVNRYQVEISRLEHDLSVAKFKLSKAQDFEIKYDILFKQNQKTVADLLAIHEENDHAHRDLDRARVEQEQLHLQIKNLRSDLQIEKRGNQQLRNTKEELRTKTTSQGQQERQALKESFARELENVKRQNREIQEKLRREIGELKGTVAMKETIEGALSAKLEHIKRQKNSQISRLKELITSLKDQLGDTHIKNQSDSRESRSSLIQQTQDRIGNIRRLAQTIQQTLIQEINNLNETLKRKNQEISFLIDCDRKQLESHENSQNALKALIAKLEDKIFIIQRESELQLYSTIERLKAQFLQNLQSSNSEWEEVRITHSGLVDSLRREIQAQKKEINLLSSQNGNLEKQCKQLAKDQQHSINMLSQKIIGMETQRDQSLKNYTTSMKQIQDDAKSKLDDLHKAIATKNNQSQILNAQITLKNGQITHLLEEISRLRDLNREKIRKLQTTNASQQNSLNNQISDYKKHIFELKRNLQQSESNLNDNEAAFNLQKEMINRELQAQKEANQKLRARNGFLAEWCAQLQRDLKAQRVSNVNILHDTNITQRENVQVRQEVRVELEALKSKEAEQLKSIHKLEKNRLQADLAKREHELRDKKEELARLLVQYKTLEAKVGKSSKVDRSAQDQGKCRATLQAEIMLTENIFNAINRP